MPAGPAPEPAGPAQVPDPAPPWAQVIGTTLRLWLQRRVLRRFPRWRALSSAQRRAVTVALSVVVIFIAGLLGALTAARTGGAPGGGQTAPGGGSGPSPAALAAAAADRRLAASWITAQVARSAIVGCDPVMCAALARSGFPASNLLLLGPASPDPLGSEIVVATAAVRSQFGSKLADVYAPGVLAGFGTGMAGVQVRVLAPDGAAAYRRATSADLAARRRSGAELLRDARLAASGLARRELATGQVDSRLLATLVDLTASYRVRVLTFGRPQRGASPGIPLRSMEIALPAAGRSGRALLAGALAVLRQQVPPYRPASTRARHVAGDPSLSIEFAAPSPPGLLHQSASRQARGGRAPARLRTAR